MYYLIMHNSPKIVMHYAICDFHSAPTWEKPKSDALSELCNSRSCIMRTSTVWCFKGDASDKTRIA